MAIQDQLNRHRHPRRGVLRTVPLALALCVAATTTQAQWQVHDRGVDGTLKKIEKHADTTAKKATSTDKTMAKMNEVLGTKVGDGTTINGNINAINEKLKIGTVKDSQPGARVAGPVKELPASTTVLDDGIRCKAVAEPQKATCQQIVDLENAQYQYMLTMYKNTETRDKMLRELLRERADIQASDANQFGKLEDNTNKLTALHNLIALDQQQMQTVNYAYEANLRYLRTQQTLAATAASSGRKPSDWGSIQIPGLGEVDLGDAASALATGVVLKETLDGAQSDKPRGMQTLRIGQSHGL